MVNPMAIRRFPLETGKSLRSFDWRTSLAVWRGQKILLQCGTPKQYPLANKHSLRTGTLPFLTAKLIIAVENHHFEWVNQL